MKNTCHGLWACEKLLTFQTVENLNSWQSLWPDNKEWHWTAFAILVMFFLLSFEWEKLNWTQILVNFDNSLYHRVKTDTQKYHWLIQGTWVRSAKYINHQHQSPDSPESPELSESPDSLESLGRFARITRITGKWYFSPFSTSFSDKIFFPSLFVRSSNGILGQEVHKFPVCLLGEVIGGSSDLTDQFNLNYQGITSPRCNKDQMCISIQMKLCIFQMLQNCSYINDHNTMSYLLMEIIEELPLKNSNENYLVFSNWWEDKSEQIGVTGCEITDELTLSGNVSLSGLLPNKVMCLS